MTQPDVDLLIVGAGISGIGAAVHLTERCPGRSYAILEMRERLGGTWDLFRYPGIRSDSDMYTLGYSFRPWTNAKAIADGPSILAYLKDVAEEYGVAEHIRYGRKAIGASWSSEDAMWTVSVKRSDGPDEKVTCRFLYMCSGYYNYDHGHCPHFEGSEDFEGEIVHPQHWPEDLDYEGKRVVVIGSGATAITLIPSMAKKTEHITMLQRSPTYIASAPAEDAIANRLREVLPSKVAYGLTRAKNVTMSMFLYNYCRLRPEKVSAFLIGEIRKRLGPDFDVEKHFTPRYDPWDQRLCLAPDGDFFDVLADGSASVVTDTIERFTPGGIALSSGEELPADIIVTATGLEVQFLSNIELHVDGRRVHAPEHVSYKGMMASDVPNLALAIGYTNASWTLKCDLTSEYVCRLLNYMEREGYDYCAPRYEGKDAASLRPLIDLTSGYVQRAAGVLPKQGEQAPWRLYQNYVLDLMLFRFARLDDGKMSFDRRRTVGAAMPAFVEEGAASAAL